MGRYDDPDDDEDDFVRKPTPWPLWVSLGLWGIPGRIGVWAFFWVTLLAGIGCTAGGFFFWPLFAGAGFFLAALWYYRAIRWVDRNSEWP